MLNNIFRGKKHPQVQDPKLISYTELSAFNDEPNLNLTLSQYTAIQNAIRQYVREGGSLESGKISRKTHKIQYSVNIAQGHFILSYHFERINETESYVYRKRGDTTPLKIDKDKKPIIYDIGIDLSSNQALFIKEYKQYHTKDKTALESSQEQTKRINKLKSEYENWTALGKPCLFWSRNDKYYSATPYVSKYDFFEWMNTNQGTAEEALEIYRSIVEQVLDLHKKGWIHCDIKAENFIPKRVNGKVQVELIDGEPFHPLDKNKNTAESITEVRSSEVNTSESWKRDFNVGKAKYGIQTDVYALNTLLFDVAVYINIETEDKTSELIAEKLNYKKNKPIDKCYSATELMGFADEISASLNKHKIAEDQNNKNKINCSL